MRHPEEGTLTDLCMIMGIMSCSAWPSLGIRAANVRATEFPTPKQLFSLTPIQYTLSPQLHPPEQPRPTCSPYAWQYLAFVTVNTGRHFNAGKTLLMSVSAWFASKQQDWPCCFGGCVGGKDETCRWNKSPKWTNWEIIQKQFKALHVGWKLAYAS